jgi:hypothetical protein
MQWLICMSCVWSCSDKLLYLMFWLNFFYSIKSFRYFVLMCYSHFLHKVFLVEWVSFTCILQCSCTFHVFLLHTDLRLSHWLPSQQLMSFTYFRIACHCSSPLCTQKTWKEKKKFLVGLKYIQQIAGPIQKHMHQIFCEMFKHTYTSPLMVYVGDKKYQVLTSNL